MINESFAVLAVLYIGTGLYIELRHGNRVCNGLTFAFVLIGFALLTATNMTYQLGPAFVIRMSEYLIIGAITLTWVALVFASREMARYRHLSG